MEISINSSFSVGTLNYVLFRRTCKANHYSLIKMSTLAIFLEFKIKRNVAYTHAEFYVFIVFVKKITLQLISPSSMQRSNMRTFVSDD